MKENKEPNQIKRNPVSLLLDLFYFVKITCTQVTGYKKQDTKINQTLRIYKQLVS
jgi:hypothetical protein